MPRRGTSGERHLALFLLGLVLLSPPLLSIFDGPGWIFGIPLLYIYLFAVWGVLIGLTALAAQRWRRTSGPRPQAGRPDLLGPSPPGPNQPGPSPPGPSPPGPDTPARNGD